MRNLHITLDEDAGEALYLNSKEDFGGPAGIRTPDLRLVRAAS